MKKYQFKLNGITPLLMHANDVEARDLITDYRKKHKGTAGDDRSPVHTWKSYVYSSESTGNLCIPAENLLGMLLVGGGRTPLKGKETLKSHSQRIGFDALDYDLYVVGKTISKSVIDGIDGEFKEHTEACRQAGFRLHVKPCKVGTSCHIRVRPMFGQWSLQGSFEIEDEDQEILTTSNLKELFTKCGRLVGVGDWRPGAPNRPGQYGRFTAEISQQ